MRRLKQSQSDPARFFHIFFFFMCLLHQIQKRQNRGKIKPCLIWLNETSETCSKKRKKKKNETKHGRDSFYPSQM